MLGPTNWKCDSVTQVMLTRIQRNDLLIYVLLALHSSLYTPMLHANMMGLLGQVYQGKISRDQAKLDEYGGQKMEAQVVQGIKIAAIDQVRFSFTQHHIFYISAQRDLEYDPNLYRKNWADDWDNQSMASTTVFGDSSVSLHPAKSHYYASEMSLPRLPGYDNYLASGPNSPAIGDIELSRMDSMNEPLLSARTGYYQQQGMSQTSVTTPPSLYQEPMMTGGSREAPLHRPQGSYDQQYPPQQQLYPPQSHHQQYSSQQSQRSMSPSSRMMTPNPQQRSMSPGPQRMMTPNPQQRTMTPNPQQQWGPNPQQQQRGPPPPAESNMAGRGAFRG